MSALYVKVKDSNGSFNWVKVGQGSGTSYVLPPATDTTLGGVKVGTGLEVTKDGTISATGEVPEGSIDWVSLKNKPTTVTGYGITDAIVDTSVKSVKIGNNTLSDLISDTNYVHTDNNFTNEEKTKLNKIEAGANINKINTIKVNGVEQDINNIDKSVNIKTPTKISDLTNDAGFITHEEAPIQSVNGQTGVVKLTAADVGALAAPAVPGTEGQFAVFAADGTIKGVTLPNLDTEAR